MSKRHVLSLFTLAFMILDIGHCSAAVFDEAAGAGVNQAYYGNWGTNADAENPAPNSYNNYRKYVDNGLNILHTAAPDAEESTLATWSNLSQQGGNGDGLRAPGMFIGQSPSTRSYPDSVLLLGGVFDVAGEGKNGDSANRTNWDIRLGFIEDPDEFVGQRTPNNGTWDLWAADWGTDGIDLQMFIQATDDTDQSPIGSTDQHIAPWQEILFQSGFTPAEGFRDERDRARSPDGIQTSEMTAFSADGEVPGIRNWTPTGIAYEDPLPIEWWMEQTNPGADPNTVEGREVTFNVRAGEALFQQSFDPGNADNPKIPNPVTDPENPFTDGFFDWQNATPVMYIGAGGGTAVGGTGQMGFFNPTPPVGCDFDNSGSCDIVDLDELLYTGLSSGDTKYDLDSSGTVDLGDRDAFLREVGSLPGDADLSGMNEAADLNALGRNWQANDITSWANGDFNGDGTGDAADLNELGLWWQQTGDDFAAAQGAAQAAVPEPGSSVLTLACLLVWTVMRRRRH